MSGSGSRALLMVAAVLILGGIASVWADCPYHCICSPRGKAIIVNCVYGDLKDFPEDMPLEVEYLNIADNWIKTLPRLSKYASLKGLNASGNRISTIQDNTFEGLRQLMLVDLSSNSISSLADINAMTLFRTNDKLETLKISMNTISTFDENSSIHSSSLKNLDLSLNSISTLDKMTLQGLPNLTRLNLARNPLKWTIGLKSNTLNYLDMSFGQMDLMTRDELEGMPQLHTLIISHNKKYNLYFRDVASKSLRNYQAAFCQLSSPGLSDFPNLEIANLRHNRIEVLRVKALVNNKNLRHLDLSGNGLKEIEIDSFLGLTNIEFLNLGQNFITVISWDMLITNHELKFLNLSNNPITSLPGNLTLSKLQELDLSQCQLQTIDSHTFSRIPFLTKLDVSRNVIERLPNRLESNSLKILDASFGRLTSINNETLSKLPNLETLNLTGNRFTNVPTTLIFSANTFLKAIQLGDNPWICECQNGEFKTFWQFLTEQPPKVGMNELDKLRCTSPPALSGKSWEQACYQNFYPTNQSGTFVEHYGVYILIIAMAVSFLLVLIITIREKLKKRKKEMRSQLEEENRRTSRENLERVLRMRQYRASATAAVFEGSNTTREDSAQEERIVSQPPTYEEAVLMPRRTVAESMEELDRVNRSGYSLDVEVNTSSPGIAAESQEASQPSRAANRPVPQPRTVPKTISSVGMMNDYDEIATESDNDDDEEAANTASARRPTIQVHVPRDEDNVGSSSDNDMDMDEAKLLQQLRIEVWSPSREDINGPN